MRASLPSCAATLAPAVLAFHEGTYKRMHAYTMNVHMALALHVHACYVASITGARSACGSAELPAINRRAS
eukprot:358843-Chlamydomonas_euryale.AAC.3